MNAELYKNEGEIRLNQMVARGGKNIFNMFMMLVRQVFSQFNELKVQFSSETTNSVTPVNLNDIHFYKVNIMQEVIDICTNYLRLSFGHSKAIGDSNNYNVIGNQANQFNSVNGTLFFYPF